MSVDAALGHDQRCKAGLSALDLRLVSLFSFLAIRLHITLQASLLRELDNPNLSVDSRAERCCEIAHEFENKDEYEDARKVLNH